MDAIVLDCRKLYCWRNDLYDRQLVVDAVYLDFRYSGCHGADSFKKHGQV